MTGKVWLVGAGPGDAGLFTLKGLEVLKNADVVVYDALVGEGVLSMIPDSAELIFAGKRSGHHFLRQDDTNKVLLREAQKGKKVVRLKGGDPFLFGRGGEELELLAEEGIPFEVVPGITSAFAVPAYNGIPVTHRDFCSSVHIITGHKRENFSCDIDFEALVRTKGTLIFLMGITAMPDITGGLIGAGMDPETPAAALEKGTTAGQRRISAPLKDLVAECERQKVRTPAIIIVGAVTSVAEKFAWAEKRPLAGTKIVVTRPKENASELSMMLRREGAEVVELPSICVRPVENREPLREAVGRIETRGFDWLVFTSPNGVRFFMEELTAQSDIRALYGVKIAVIGKGSEKELRKYGLKADFIPSVYDGETLGKELAAVCGENARILIPRAAIGNRELPEALAAVKGVSICDIPIYDTYYETEHPFDIGPELENGEIDFAVFTSASTVRGFAESLKGADLTRVCAVCIGRQTEAQARACGMKTRTAEKATLSALTECVRKAAEEKRNQEEA